MAVIAMQTTEQKPIGLKRRAASVGATLLRRALDLAYPPRAVCAGCGEKSGCREDYLCAACLEELKQSRQGILMNPFNSRLCGRAHAYAYSSPAGHIVRALKYSGVRALVPIMARDMAWLLRQAGEDAPLLPRFHCVVSVPMHRFRRYIRGMNHAELLAKAVAAELELPWEDALVRTRATKQQARLSGEERRQNLAGAFLARPEVRGRSILLVDDVYTTGSTAEECADALLKAGAIRVFLLTYALA